MEEQVRELIKEWESHIEDLEREAGVESDAVEQIAFLNKVVVFMSCVQDLRDILLQDLKSILPPE